MRETQTLRVFLVDDHELVRVSLRKLLESEDGIEVVGEAGSLAGLAEAVRKAAPDVVLMDISLRGEADGFEGARMVKEACPDAAVLMLTMHADEAMLEEAAKVGASGYVLKAASPDELIAAILAVANGAGWISPQMASKLMDRIAGRQGRLGPGRDEAAVARYGLTPRELEVLERIVKGMTYEEMAKELFVSRSQVKQLAGSLCRKLGARDKAHAAAIAVAQRLVPPPE
ncbi:MAG: response regulator transcription factor [Armatimonadetes bacterium]|nr:response regulator transcription factor [Armatimonadota bacterium]